MNPEIPQIDDVGQPEIKPGQSASIQRQVARGYRQFLIRRGLLNEDFKINHRKQAASATSRMLRRLAGNPDE